jgi:hypothetical protein
MIYVGKDLLKEKPHSKIFPIYYSKIINITIYLQRKNLSGVSPHRDPKATQPLSNS